MVILKILIALSFIVNVVGSLIWLYFSWEFIRDKKGNDLLRAITVASWTITAVNFFGGAATYRVVDSMSGNVLAMAVIAWLCLLAYGLIQIGIVYGQFNDSSGSR